MLIEILIAVLLGGAIFAFFYFKKEKEPKETPVVENNESNETKKKSKSKKPIKKQNITQSTQIKLKGSTPSHPQLVTILRNHQNYVTCIAISNKSKMIATASLDNTLRVYDGASLTTKSQKVFRINCEYDYASAMCFSEDDQFLIVTLENSHDINFYKIPSSFNSEEKPSLYKSFKTNNIGSIPRIFSSGTGDNIIIYTTCLDNDNIIKVWDYSGKKISQEDIKQNVIYDVVSSKNGQFLAPASFCSGVKIYEGYRTREGTFKKLTQIMTLNGHKSGITALGFGNLNSKVITVSKDKTWKIWGISVRYNEGGEPHLLYSYNNNDDLSVQFALLSETLQIAVLIAEGDIYMYKIENGEEVMKIEQPHNGYIKSAIISNNGKLLLTMGADDKHVCLWNLMIK